MLLLRLPPEILAQIFDLVGSPFFREDLGRLTVCKHWLTFAIPTHFKCIALSRKTLRTLMASGVTKRLSLKHSLKTLGLELGGYDPSCGSFAPQQNAQDSNASSVIVASETFNDTPAKTWINVLNDDLTELAFTAQQSPRLRSMRIRAWSSPSPDTLEEPERYLSLPAIKGFLSVKNLSVLVLDLPVSLLNSSREQVTDLHICPAIGALLGTLQTLHLRMCSICPDVLKPQESHNGLRLSNVVINLSLMTNQPGITFAAHSKRCGSLAGGLLQLEADIQEQAQELATRMESPKIMRVLTHSLPRFQTRSFDVLTGKIMTLDDDMAWDEDGETVPEEPGSDSDLIDDDSSTFSDD
ncbi:hypothetical protein F5Y14DRAFT_84266 [Nemania sp. NC0429]|nr:hypothetical protein F5Y14DRAFT_84266 [Nemania sp. NC0429]